MRQTSQEKQLETQNAICSLALPIKGIVPKSPFWSLFFFQPFSCTAAYSIRHLHGHPLGTLANFDFCNKIST